MALPYTPPGVTVSELATPSVAPFIVSPGAVAIVGLSSGTIRRTDAVTLTGTTAVVLPGVPLGASLTTGAIVSVKASDPAVAHGSYVYNTTNGYGASEYTFSNTAKTIARVASGGGGAAGASAIPDGSTVYVTYDYLPDNYFTAQKFTDLSSVEERYGSALNTSGTAINSFLSFGAAVAFQSGAREVYCAPLFKLTTASDPTTVRNQPANAGEIYAATTWEQTLYGLRDFDDVSTVFPAVGQVSGSATDQAILDIFSKVQDHISFQKDAGQYIVAYVGEDSTQGSTVTASTLRTHAQTLRARYGGTLSENIVLVNSTKLKRPLPFTGADWYIGGQWAAASLAGLNASLPPATPCTRLTLPGFTANADQRIKAERLKDASEGLTVLETREGSVQIKHGITIDNTAVDRRELSVVRAKHRMNESIRTTIDEQLIGKVFTDEDAPAVVASAVTGVLALLKQQGIIGNYADVQARTLAGDPTTVEVRFSYKPLFPLNYVAVKFSLNTTTREVTF